MTSNKNIYLLFTLILIVTNSCKNNKPSPDAFHFTLMNANETNISFNNKITESDSINVFLNEYMYNGSGVGIGDFNNDGLQDIFFGGSMVSSKLYINKGNFKFEDITDKAGLATNQWCTGISVVDINNDGFMDIYICSSHSKDKEKRRNLLYINDGHLHFTEQAAAYDLADTGYSTQAAFFDYDKDGDLDMYLLNHRLYNTANNNLAPKDTSGNSPAEDRLYRNDGVKPGQSHPVFTDVSKQAGIKEDGYGLGVVITDVNNDGWPDVYVANDYIGNDLMWLNNKNGTFTNIISTSLRHQSYNSMGVDAADINNDGLCDIAVLDMLPESNERKKMMFNATSQEKYDMALRIGYEPAFVRNMLQLNNGLRKNNNRSEPFYSEIGQFAGIAETDWSWSVLMADFDNDGWKDMHVTNGLAKDVTNNDYASFRNAHTQNNYFENGNVSTTMDKKTIDMLRENLDHYGSLKVNNYFFHNNGNLTFSNTTDATGLAVPSVSNGAAYVDLDNDGDLDMVVNNMNQDAFIWRNDLRKSAKDSAHNFLTIQLNGAANNLNGIGSKVTLFNKGTMQFLEQAPVRGFSSSVDYRLHFGVANATSIDSLKIVWPDDRVQVITNVKTNQLLTLKHTNASMHNEQMRETQEQKFFTDVTQQNHIGFAHVESQYYDFGSRRALPQKYSQLGPDITTGDVNGDGLTDFFVCGAASQSGKIFIQKSDGSFITKNLVEGIKPEEDLGAILFDADGDNDPDLLITGGSPEFGDNIRLNQPRLYNNDGKGNFTLNTTALPNITDITKAAAVADLDGDGDLDIFIGGRLMPQKYPQSPRSYILRNNHGKFTDVTNQLCPSLQYAGLVTGAVFTDFNGDKKPDIIICGEWMPVRFFENNNGKFTEVTKQTGLENMNGQWRSLQAADIDNDGDLDFIAGNLGENNNYHIQPERPLKLYAGDFDGNNSTDIIPAYFMKDNSGKYDLFPALDRAQLADEMPIIKKKYLYSSDYAKVTMASLLSNVHAKDMVEKDCETTTTVWIENLGNGKFKQHGLPAEAQLAPINTIVASDIDNDGAIDLLLAGNEYQTEFMTGRYDASYGVILKGNGKGTFKALQPASSGFILDGDVRSLKVININKKKNILAGFNNDKLRCFRLNYKANNN